VPDQYDVLKVLIASPDDVADERAIASKVIDDGYLAIGNKKLTFKRHN